MRVLVLYMHYYLIYNRNTLVDRPATQTSLPSLVKSSIPQPTLLYGGDDAREFPCTSASTLKFSPCPLRANQPAA